LALSSLKIENIAVIERAEIDFDGGFCVLTGETGAGKSILIDSLASVLGSRTSKDLVRSGCEKGSVVALFTDISKEVKEQLAEYGIDGEEDELLISRTITVEGKSTCKINGSPVTASILKSISGNLVNIHGQQDSYTLFDSNKHFRYVDKMGDYDHLLSEYKENYLKLKALKKELLECEMDNDDKLRQLDILSFQIEELESANIVVGERDALIEKRDLFRNSEHILTTIRQVAEALKGSENSGAIDMVKSAANQLSKGAKYSQTFEKYADRITDISYELDEISEDVLSLEDEISLDPSELEQIEDRLDLYHRLSKKYGADETEMLRFLEEAKVKYDNINYSDKRREELISQFNSLGLKTRELADTIMQKRLETGNKMAEAICNELEYLDMPNVKFVVDIKSTSLGPNGGDTLEFLISSNPGEPPKPLSKIASGGELSRTMLAILSVLMDKDEVPTLVFDEIDTGISGRAAGKVARRMKKIAVGRQVICITHLAQIAAAADRHYFIEKVFKNERAFTDITPLDKQGQKMEIARIMGGETITESKRIISYGGYAVRKHQISRKATAIHKRTISNDGYTVRKRQISRKATAITKCPITYSVYTSRNN